MHFFTIQRKSDGKTDNIYEFDFASGKFIGGADNYRYEDIMFFIGVPSEIIREIAYKERRAKKQTEEDE